MTNKPKARPARNPTPIPLCQPSVRLGCSSSVRSLVGRLLRQRSRVSGTWFLPSSDPNLTTTVIWMELPNHVIVGQAVVGQAVSPQTTTTAPVVRVLQKRDRQTPPSASPDSPMPSASPTTTSPTKCAPRSPKPIPVTVAPTPRTASPPSGAGTPAFGLSGRSVRLNGDPLRVPRVDRQGKVGSRANVQPSTGQRIQRPLPAAGREAGRPLGRSARCSPRSSPTAATSAFTPWRRSPPTSPTEGSSTSATGVSSRRTSAPRSPPSSTASPASTPPPIGATARRRPATGSASSAAQAIEPEHLLLGLVRSGDETVGELLARVHVTLEDLRQEIESRGARLKSRLTFWTRLRKTVSTTHEIPFSPREHCSSRRQQKPTRRSTATSDQDTSCWASSRKRVRLRRRCCPDGTCASTPRVRISSVSPAGAQGLRDDPFGGSRRGRTRAAGAGPR